MTGEGRPQTQRLVLHHESCPDLPDDMPWPIMDVITSKNRNGEEEQAYVCERCHDRVAFTILVIVPLLEEQ